VTLSENASRTGYTIKIKLKLRKWATLWYVWWPHSEVGVNQKHHCKHYHWHQTMWSYHTCYSRITAFRLHVLVISVVQVVCQCLVDQLFLLQSAVNRKCTQQLWWQEHCSQSTILLMTRVAHQLCTIQTAAENIYCSQNSCRPQTKPNNQRCESAYRLLLPTATISILGLLSPKADTHLAIPQKAQLTEAVE